MTNHFQKIIHDLSTDQQFRNLFLSDPQAALAGVSISAEEQDILLSMRDLFTEPTQKAAKPGSQYHMGFPWGYPWGGVRETEPKPQYHMGFPWGYPWGGVQETEPEPQYHMGFPWGYPWGGVLEPESETR